MGLELGMVVNGDDIGRCCISQGTNWAVSSYEKNRARIKDISARVGLMLGVSNQPKWIHYQITVYSPQSVFS